MRAAKARGRISEKGYSQILVFLMRSAMSTWKWLWWALLASGPSTVLKSVQAVRWFRLAAEQNQPTAQYNLGVMLSEGRGVPADLNVPLILVFSYEQYQRAMLASGLK